MVGPHVVSVAPIGDPSAVQSFVVNLRRNSGVDRYTWYAALSHGDAVPHMLSSTSIPAAVRIRLWIVERGALNAAEQAETALLPSALSSRISIALHDMGEVPRLLYLRQPFSASYVGRKVSSEHCTGRREKKSNRKDPRIG